ncbi:putative uncharacterized protein DDB_G0274435, partial [Pocillopora damicornis]
VVMSWTEEKDVLLMREMAAQGIFQFKSGSRERGTVWQAITKNLNGHKDLFHSVTSRGVSDRFTLILRRYKAKNAEELKSTGEGSEDEYDLLLEELTHLSEESDKKANAEAESAKEKISAEKELALDIRKRAMETMGQTSKRTKSDELQDNEINERKKGRTGGDTLAWLEKKADRDLKYKELQLEEQRKEREFQQRERKEQMELIQKQLQMQGESQKQQQQQQMMLMQQMMSIMQQQQQQLQLFTSKQDKD